MQDHDQRFKNLIKEFFADFLSLFFAPWAERLDCSRVEWLDKEVFLDPPQGDRNVLDLVGKLPAREEIPGHHADEQGSWLALVHIEIESPDKAAPLRPRMYRAYTALRERYGLPVLPIAIYLKVALDGTGIDGHEERFWELEIIRFRYLYVGLPGLDAIEYVQQDNWLGVALAALMRIPKDQAAWLGAEALRRLKDAPLTEQQRFLLGECVQAYLPLDEAQQREYEKFLASEKYTGVQAMNKTVYEKGLEQGFEKGLEQGREEQRTIERREVLREQMEDKFGSLPDAIVERLQQMTFPELKQLGMTVLRAQSLTELGLDPEVRAQK